MSTAAAETPARASDTPRGLPKTPCLRSCTTGPDVRTAPPESPSALPAPPSEPARSPSLQAAVPRAASPRTSADMAAAAALLFRTVRPSFPAPDSSPPSVAPARTSCPPLRALARRTSAAPSGTLPHRVLRPAAAVAAHSSLARPHPSPRPRQSPAPLPADGPGTTPPASALRSGSPAAPHLASRRAPPPAPALDRCPATPAHPARNPPTRVALPESQSSPHACRPAAWRNSSARASHAIESAIRSTKTLIKTHTSRVRRKRQRPPSNGSIQTDAAIRFPLFHRDYCAASLPI